MPHNGLDEFKEVLADFRNISSLALKGTVTVPFADLILRQFDTGISPPWPPGILVITSVVEFLVLAVLFNFFFGSSKTKLDGMMIASLVLLVVSFVGYLYIFSSYTEKHPKTKQALILGYQPINNDIKQSFAEGYTNPQMLSENEYDPAKIWTQQSITIVQIVILLGWLLAFISLSGFMGFFVIAQRRGTD